VDEVQEEVSRSYSLGSYISDLQSFVYQGHRYTLPGSKQDEIGGEFQSLVCYAYKANGVVFACMLVRQLLFSEARFQFRQIRSGRPGKLYGTDALRPLEEPWPGGTTGDLLTRMEQDSSLAGNSFVVRRATGKLRRLRPDWVDLLLGSESDVDIGAWDVDADVLGYVYWPGGRNSGREPDMFLAEEVAHYAPIPDPEAQFRGMSWLTPIVREIMADKATTDHKLSFLENGATPNLVVKLDVQDLEKFEKWIEKFKATHEGASNAYKTMFLGAGADATVVGTDLKQLEFKQTQGAGETRIAAAAGVPPVIVGLSEGLQAATYSNYGQARRRFADGTMRPLWRNAAGSLARLIDVPSNSELWYDDRDISFLKEDVLDAAEILSRKMLTIESGVRSGYTPESVVAAVDSGDLTLLEHTGLFSVQLQPPGTEAPATNGAVPDEAKTALTEKIAELAK
jgi:HK97 family phage portal protein